MPAANTEPLVCLPPRFILCTQPGPDGEPAFCQCLQVDPPPPPPFIVTPPANTCTVALVYPKDAPHLVYIGALENGCDQAGAEIALAVLLTQFLRGIIGR